MVRRAVAVKLQKVQRQLQTQYLARQLVVVEGYRHPYIQGWEFLQQFLMLARQYPTIDVAEIEERVNQWAALPSVAGHPTGGAVDVTLADNGQNKVGDVQLPILAGERFADLCSGIDSGSTRSSPFIA